MFPCLISRTSTTDVISSGMDGTRNGALQLMHAELQVLSPLVPIREVNFLRFCKQHAEGVWAVVDVSIETIRETFGAPTFPNCRRLPSGCVVQDMPNGYSKGVDSIHDSSDAVEAAKFLAQQSGRVVAVFGAVDCITNGDRVVCVHNGLPMLQKINVSGCTVTVLITAFDGVDPSHSVEASEIGMKMASSPASLQTLLIDSLYGLDKAAAHGQRSAVFHKSIQLTTEQLLCNCGAFSEM